MTWSAPSSLPRAHFAGPPAVAITVARHSFAIWIAALPTPLPAAWTSTVSPGFSAQRATSMCHAVRDASGHAAASSKLIDAGFGMRVTAVDAHEPAQPPRLLP